MKTDMIGGLDEHDIKMKLGKMARLLGRSMVGTLAATWTKRKERPMPNEPMTPEAFAESMRVTYQIGANEGPVYCDKPECQKAEAVANIKLRDAQLIASTLQAAANRVCSDCGLNGNGAPCTDECSERKAVLATLDKTDKGE